MKKIIVFVVLFVLCCFLVTCDQVGELPGGNPADVTSDSYSGFIRAKGQLLVDKKDRQFLIKGVAFGNKVWDLQPVPYYDHHSEVDFERVKEMGFNSIRFYLSYHLFENDDNPYVYKESGFDWLEENIRFAKKHGIYLVLNIHVPQGGFQPNGEGNALWENPENQNRLIALWKEIAKRYKNEKIVIGYGLINEPRPTGSVSQMTALYQKIIDEIRSVDKNHILFIERAIAVGNEWTEDENINFPAGLNDAVSPSNMVYEYHLYAPNQFTHQNASWLPDTVGKFATYPDITQAVAVGQANWTTGNWNNPTLASGDTDWTYLEGELFTIETEGYILGQTVFEGSGIGSTGTVWVDDIVIEEYDETGTFVEVIRTYDCDSFGGWSYWKADNTGKGGFDGQGRLDDTSLYIRGAESTANIGNYANRLRIKKGFNYKISAWVKGENVAEGAVVRLRTDVYTSDSPIQVWDKTYLEEEISRYVEYGKIHNVPVYLGEFGTIRDSFLENRGGDVWVEDMLDILVSNNVNYNYHTYRESAFGIYYTDTGLPDPAFSNTLLIDLFKRIQGTGR